jgi:iron-sulfur cluster assembly protein
MLAVSQSAVQAIRGLTSGPGVPEGTGLKISAQATVEGTSIDLSLVEGPAESDQVVEAEGVKVFVAEPLAPMLDDKVLDASDEGEKISFRLGDQAP